jgi:hypothetical protein
VADLHGTRCYSDTIGTGAALDRSAGKRRISKMQIPKQHNNNRLLISHLRSDFVNARLRLGKRDPLLSSRLFHGFPISLTRGFDRVCPRSTGRPLNRFTGFPSLAADQSRRFSQRLCGKSAVPSESGLIGIQSKVLTLARPILIMRMAENPFRRQFTNLAAATYGNSG